MEYEMCQLPPEIAELWTSNETDSQDLRFLQTGKPANPGK